MTKEEKLAKIYEVIADKTLSFGCRVKIEGVASEDIVLEYTPRDGDKQGFEWKRYMQYMRSQKFMGGPAMTAIGHPVYIGDVIDWREHNYPPTMCQSYEDGDEFSRVVLDLCVLWTKKRLPIDEQDDACIDFIYGLLQDAKRTKMP